LVTATELNIVWAVVASKLLFKNSMLAVKVVKSLEGTLDCIPPPVRYLIVKVVFEGAIP
jgi:hypothetical protein